MHRTYRYLQMLVLAKRLVSKSSLNDIKIQVGTCGNLLLKKFIFYGQNDVGNDPRTRMQAGTHLNKQQERGHRLESSTDRHLPSVIPESAAEVETPGLIVEYYFAIIRYKVLIGMIAVSCAVAGVLFHLRTEPIYRARVSLGIQRLNVDFLNIYSVNTTNSTPTDTHVQTQIKLLESGSFLSRVKDRLIMEQHPAFILRTDLLSRAQRASHLGHPSVISYEDLLNETAKSVKIKPFGTTQLTEITCDSWDAAVAAHFCNTLTNELQTSDLESRGNQAKKISDWLVRQAGDIRQKAEDSEQKLIAATGGNHLMLNSENDSEGEDGLQQLQSELVHAQAARMEKEAELVTTQQSQDRGLGADTPVYAANKARLADLQNQVAALVPRLTEANPKIIHLRSEIRQVQKNLQSENQESDSTLRNEFAVAKHHEDLLAMSYRARVGHAFPDLQKNSQIEMLRHDVQAGQQLYQTLLQRAKDAGFASALPASTIRIVDAAKAPGFPFYPQRSMDMVVGLILGGFVGVLIALFSGQNALVLWLPGDSEKLVHTNELGVISSPRNARALFYTNRSASKSVQGVSSLPGRVHQSLSSAGWSDQLSLVAEAYRNTSLSIMLAEYAQQAKTCMITSLGTGEGKSTIVSNLGIALSKARQRVMLIDGDLRQSNLHRIFSLPNQVGLRQILLGEVPSTDNSLVEVCQATAFENLFVISSGSRQDTAVELSSSLGLNHLIDLLSDLFDVILVDTPPMLHMADARIFASHVQGTILVLRSGVTTREDELTARAMLERNSIRVIGSILNDFDLRGSEKNGYQHPYAAYQRQSELEGHAAVRP